MMTNIKNHFRAILLLLLLSSIFGFVANETFQPGILNAENKIKILDESIKSEFPQGIRYQLQIDSPNPIEEVVVRFRIGQQTIMVYDYMELETAETIHANFFWRTNTASRYIPPGTIITYSFEILDSNSEKFITEPKEFVYDDPNYIWEYVSNGSVTVGYHGPIKRRAQAILDITFRTVEHMGPVLGSDLSIPIRITIYNNNKEMLGALAPGSKSIRRELITEGQAYTTMGTILMQAGGSLALGTASHEVTHILIHRAAEKRARSVPSWLHEGLAEYGNLNSGFSYDAALDFAIETNRLLPITTMQGMPGTADDIMIFYGQSKSLISFIAKTYGEESIKELMASIKTGKNTETTFKLVYGISLLEVENSWRISVGAPEYDLLDKEKLLPTPIPIATIAPYTVKNLSRLGQKTNQETSSPSLTKKKSKKPEQPEATISLTTKNSQEIQKPSSGSCNFSKSNRGVNSMGLPLILIIGLIPFARKKLNINKSAFENKQNDES